MGVKTTVWLTREEAVGRYIELKLTMKRQKYEAKATRLSNSELEDKLEKLNDARIMAIVGGDTGFENYLIVEGSNAD